jgi:hypothetical protein
MLQLTDFELAALPGLSDSKLQDIGLIRQSITADCLHCREFVSLWDSYNSHGQYSLRCSQCLGENKIVSREQIYIERMNFDMSVDDHWLEEFFGEA